MQLPQRLLALHKQLQLAVAGVATASPCVLVVSVGSASSRAQVFRCAGESFALAWAEVERACERWYESKREGPAHLRIDWIDSVQQLVWGELEGLLKQNKRNYFMHGISLDAGLNQVFLQEELNANAMLYPGSAIGHAQLNPANFTLYAQRKFGKDCVPDFTPTTLVWLFTTQAAYSDLFKGTYNLENEGAAAGRRQLHRLDAKLSTALVSNGSEFLARQVKADGYFVYGLFPCFNREVAGYNTLRHASSIYAMIEAWEVTQSASLKQAIDRALLTLTTQLIRPIELPNKTVAAALVDSNNEIKLGGNAVCILAMAKYTEVTGDRQYLPLMQKLANTMVAMLDPQTCKFTHVLNYPDLSVKEHFRIIYYDGEAAFALMRLYGLTKNPRWLKAVEMAFEYFIAADHWKAHDHWLSYCVNALTEVRPERKYFEFGIRNVADYLDFVLNRITTFPTLLELMMAAEQMLQRLRSMPEHADLLARVDLPRFYLAMHTRANYLLNGYFWPEWAMFFQKPDRLNGSFFIRHHSFRVRIDDVEHYLSGLIAYRKYLLNNPENNQEFMLSAVPKTTAWTPEVLAAVTGGSWAVPPPLSWQPTGVCVTLNFFSKGQLIVTRHENEIRWVASQSLHSLNSQPMAVMSTRAPAQLPQHCGVLLVNNNESAVMALARHARQQFSGKVIGVTGSAGKTSTVAMLNTMLGNFGRCSATRGNANLPLGIAWNLASTPWQNDFVVLEMAIGRMKINTALAQPHIAVVTNIGHSHLEYHQTIENIARRKARIFAGLPKGGVAIVNRDTACFELLETEAGKFPVQLVTYGKHPASNIRLLRHCTATGGLEVTIQGEVHCGTMAAAGEHTVSNLLACIAVAVCLGIDASNAMATCQQFTPLKGRGNVFEAAIDGKQFTVIDESYNANPLSMKAAIRHAIELGTKQGKKPWLVLGDMYELADQAETLHRSLLEVIDIERIAGLILVGEHMQSLAAHIDQQKIAIHTLEQVEHLFPLLGKKLLNNDLVLIKGSHGTRLHEVVDRLADNNEHSINPNSNLGPSRT